MFQSFSARKPTRTTLIKYPEFNQIRSALKSKQKDFKRKGKGNKQNAVNELSKEEVQQLFDKKLLGPFSSESMALFGTTM